VTTILPEGEGRTYKETCEAMGIGRTTLESWVRQLKAERAGKVASASPLTPEQREIRDLKKKIKRIEEEKEILKNVWSAPFLQVKARCQNTFASMYPACL